ncbi:MULTISPECIES: DnaB-like helicase C-terminal domain-containing protein [unclassified Mesotoga]|uniref:DnaB-like helicase C-terminal domain-containing protein n=1 Tax=unclassified Mesotoga TaxID=1184398 RepID=UPI0025E55AFC|nr:MULTISPECIES: DnaB-like helicase C-terminal domain-containing protein [unclassified Mesotoga]
MKNLNWPYRGLSNYLQPITSGHLVVVGGLHMSGKTTFLLNLAYKFALEGGRVAFFSCSEPSKNLQTRLLQRVFESQLKLEDTKDLPTDELDELNRSLYELKQLTLDIVDLKERSIERTIEVAAELHHSRGIEIFIIDDLYLLSGKRKACGLLKQVGKTLGIAFILATKLKRSAYRNAGKMPRIEDFEGNGSYLAEADTIMLLHCPSDHCSSSNGIDEVKITLSRAGGVDVDFREVFQFDWSKAVVND